MPTKIREVMTATPTVIRPTTTALELIERFDGEDVSAFPVVNPDGTLCGIVTKLDLLRLFRPEPRASSLAVAQVGERRVADVMRPGVFTLEPDDPLVAAIDLMVETRLRSLPVVERRRGGPPVLVGMVSQGDVLRALRAGEGAAVS
jgi:CBS-domain-containing membrane protein